MNATERATERVQLRERVRYLEGKLTSYWATYGGCSDAAGEKFVAEKEALRDRVRVLEGAIDRVLDKESNGTKSYPNTDAVGAFYSALLFLRAARKAAPPAETPAPTCANCKGAGRWWDTVRETYTPCQCGAKAETPAPTPANIRCPYCDTRHIDIDEWATRPHHKHKCAACERLFRFEGTDGEYFFGIPDDDHYAGAGHDVARAPVDRDASGGIASSIEDHYAR
jgi:hypothetical protein